MRFDCYHEASKVRALPEFWRLVHFLLPTASQRGAHISVPTFTSDRKEAFVLAKNAKGVAGICGGVHGRSQGLQRPTEMATSVLICGWSALVPEYASLVRMPENAHPRQVHSHPLSDCRAARREHP
jgi:hypothetical protein